MTAGSHDDLVTASDVRHAQFTLVKRGGYDTQEVDAFLDQVAETLDQAPAAGLGAGSVPAPAADVAPRPAAVPERGEAQLYDPDGAAQRLLAAAQRTSDTLTADAQAYSEQLRREADEYAAATRSGADEHASSVTASADAQAAAIREAAADEARRVAEKTRTALVDDIERLEREREALAEQRDGIEARFASERERLLSIVDGLRVAIAGADPNGPDGPSGTGGSGRDAGSASTSAPGLAADVDLTSRDSAGSVNLRDGGTEAAAAAAPGAGIAEEAPSTEEVPSSEEAADHAIEVGRAEADEAEPAVAVVEPDGPARETRHDLFSDVEPTPAGEPLADLADIDDRTERARARAGTIFDVEAAEEIDPGPPTEAMATIGGGDATGQHFLDDLGSAENDDGLGPLDDDTDAALTAFFDGDDGDDDERWRRRFGGRG